MRFELTEKAFRKWEHVIAEAVAKHPSPVLVHIKGVQPITAVYRLRDAILSLRRYRWRTTIPMDKFLQLRLLVTKTDRDDTIVIRGDPLSGPKPRGETLVVNCHRPLPPEVIRAICLLVRYSVVLEAHLENSTPEQQAMFQQTATELSLSFIEEGGKFVIV